MTLSRGTCTILVGLALTCLALLAGCDVSESPPAVAKDSPLPKEDAPNAVPAVREGWPTEAQAKAAIFKVEYAIQASDTNKQVWKVKDMRHEVQSVQFAKQTTQKQMNFGASAITVYPAKILYTRITDYEHKEATREQLGADGVWFLYRDSFGQWTAKYGSE